MAENASASGPEPSLHLPHIPIGEVASHLTQLAMVGGAVLYLMGLLRLSGELAQVGLASPNVIAGFTHSYVVMTGVAVLAANAPVLVIVVAFAAAVASHRVHATLGRALLGAGTSRGSRHRLVVGVLLAAGLVLGSRWWVATAFVVAALVAVVAWRLRGRLPGRLQLGAWLFGAVLSLGVLGPMLNSVPLMGVEVSHEGEPVARGLLLGQTATEGWYVAVPDGDGHRLEVAHAGESPSTLQVTPPAGGQPTTVARHIAGLRR